MKTKTIKPSKQRKRYFNRPLHQRKKGMTARLSKELQEKYGVKRIPVVRGDKVVVVKAIREEDEIKGKVIRCLPQKYAIHIEGHSKEKADGTIKSFPVKPSNIIITSLNLKDKKRKELLKRLSVKELTDEELEESIFEEETEVEETLDESYDFEEDFEEDLEEDSTEEENE
ncbi:MAG: 50S ribosomal protein L24 [Candidatus Heimdallarchaeaceae archaeon]